MSSTLLDLPPTILFKKSDKLFILYKTAIAKVINILLVKINYFKTLHSIRGLIIILSINHKKRGIIPVEGKIFFWMIILSPGCTRS